jgi:hypothetical protein
MSKLYVVMQTSDILAIKGLVFNECLSAGENCNEAMQYAVPYLKEYAEAMLRTPSENQLNSLTYLATPYNVNYHKDMSKYHLVS